MVSHCIGHALGAMGPTAHRGRQPTDNERTTSMHVQRVRFELDTPASVESVWATLEDYATWSMWGPWDTSEIERPGDTTPPGLGAIRRLRIGRRVLREETSLFEPMREMRYRVLGGIPVRDYE